MRACIDLAADSLLLHVHVSCGRRRPSDGRMPRPSLAAGARPEGLPPPTTPPQRPRCRGSRQRAGQAEASETKDQRPMQKGCPRNKRDKSRHGCQALLASRPHEAGCKHRFTREMEAGQFHRAFTFSGPRNAQPRKITSSTGSNLKPSSLSKIIGKATSATRARDAKAPAQKCGPAPKAICLRVSRVT